MGPSPPLPSSHLTPSRPSASPPPPPPPSLPYLISASNDWFLNASDRDTQILTQALTHELSSCSRPPAPACSSSSPSSLLPSPASWSSSSPVYETVSHYLEERPLHSQSFEASWALQQQQKAAAMSRAWPCGDGFSFLEQNSQLKGSPLSSNSSPPLSASVEAPASPFSTSTLSTNSAVSTIATESLFAHLKPNNSQHHGSQDARVARRVASSLKPSEVSSMCSDSSLPSKAASIALSSQASAGAGGCKVNKRRIRSKAPIAVLSADTSNFRAMVQQLTGISSSSSIQSLTHGGLPLLKPQPIRHPFTDNLNLPTLDTSECFLGPKNMKEGFSFAHKPHQISSRVATNLSSFAGVDLSKVEGRNVDNNMLQRHMPPYDKQSVFDDQGNGINHSFSSMLPSRWNSADSLKFSGNYSSLHDGEQIATKQSMMATPATLDNSLMEEHSAPKLATNAVESWLSFFDGTAHANHASNMEIARMA